MKCQFDPTDIIGTYKCSACGFVATNITVLPISKTCDVITQNKPDIPLLTIGMATYKDFEGVWATVQSLKFYHNLEDCDLLVIDNYGCDLTKELCVKANIRYIRNKEVTGTAAPRELLFKEATGEFVMCLDSHVMLERDALDLLKSHLLSNRRTDDLYHGPLLHDDLVTISTDFNDEWRQQMWGTWNTDQRGYQSEPFEIWGSGLGLFVARRESWLGFNEHFRGFGGEEGYIHEKYRKAGRKVMCLPWLIWHHRFGRTHGTGYPLSNHDKFRNYLIGHHELGLDPSRMMANFRDVLDEQTMQSIVNPSATQNFTQQPLPKQHIKVRRGKHIVAIPFKVIRK